MPSRLSSPKSIFNHQISEKRSFQSKNKVRRFVAMNRNSLSSKYLNSKFIFNPYSFEDTANLERANFNLGNLPAIKSYKSAKMGKIGMKSANFLMSAKTKEPLIADCHSTPA
jgi:hypothetical protein